MAAVFVTAAKSVSVDMKLPIAERDRLADVYAKHAVQLLYNAKEAHRFDSAEQRDQAKADSNLDFVRPREDFRKLWQTVAGEK